MDILTAINTRRSIRRFRPVPIEKDVLREVLEAAGRAPSSENTQPWEFHVAAGDVLDAMREENLERFRSMAFPPEEAHHLIVDYPRESVYRERKIAIARQLFALMGIERHDKEKRQDWMERGFRYFDAPAAVVLCADNLFTTQAAYLDVGLATQNLCLAALEFGLGTCIENQGITYSDVVRKHLGIADNKRLIAAVAIGYPDPDFPANKVESQRAPIEEMVSWHGM